MSLHVLTCPHMSLYVLICPYMSLCPYETVLRYSLRTKATMPPTEWLLLRLQEEKAAAAQEEEAAAAAQEEEEEAAAQEEGLAEWKAVARERVLQAPRARRLPVRRGMRS